MGSIIFKKRQNFRKTIVIGTNEWGKIVQKDIDNKYNCICGHIQGWHKDRSEFCAGLSDAYYKGYSVLKFKPTDLCSCLKFRMKDNLVYLLQKYEERLKEKP